MSDQQPMADSRMIGPVDGLNGEKVYLRNFLDLLTALGRGTTRHEIIVEIGLNRYSAIFEVPIGKDFSTVAAEGLKKIYDEKVANCHTLSRDRILSMCDKVIFGYDKHFISLLADESFSHHYVYHTVIERLSSEERKILSSCSKYPVEAFNELTSEHCSQILLFYAEKFQKKFSDCWLACQVYYYLFVEQDEFTAGQLANQLEQQIRCREEFLLGQKLRHAQRKGGEATKAKAAAATSRRLALMGDLIEGERKLGIETAAAIVARRGECWGTKAANKKLWYRRKKA